MGLRKNDHIQKFREGFELGMGRAGNFKHQAKLGPKNYFLMHAFVSIVHNCDLFTTINFTLSGSAKSLKYERD